jgi:CheY-like chemotaxis protein
VRAASGGELIQRLAEEGPFDLIVTDISMPWMSGIQVTQTARTAGLNTPVIVITALKNGEVTRQMAALGSNAILLRKPFDLAQLYFAVEQMLGK